MVVGLFIESVLHIATPTNFLLIILGVTIGTIAGAIPGFLGSNTVAIFLPITIAMEPEIAIVFLSCLYLGANYGGAIPAVLINTPGTAQATATVLDAYPMSRGGQPSMALGISILASSLGGFISVIFILLLLPTIGDFAFLFANREIFVLGLFGLAAVSVALGDDIKKGIVSGFLGLFLAVWSVDPATSQSRMDFGLYALYDQAPFIPVVIGLFAISELIYLINKRQISETADVETTYSGALEGFVYCIKRPIAVLRATLIGLFVGAMPGAGATMANFVSWSTAKSMSDSPESFGKGNPDGVVASEASNSAVTGGSLVPTITLGIPGSGTTAVMLAALLLHGIRPGPQLMQDFAFEANVIMVALLFANIVLLFVGLLISKYIVRVVLLPTKYLVPAILVLTVIGSFVLRSSTFDVWWMFLFGIIGLLMRENNYSMVPLILGIILGPIIEGSYRRSLLVSSGDPMYFFGSRIAIVLWMLTFAILIGRPLYDRYGGHVKAAILYRISR